MCSNPPSTGPTQEDTPIMNTIEQLNPLNHIHLQQRYKNDEKVGDGLTLPKPFDITRIRMWNPNGIRVGPGGTLSMELQHAKEAEVDILVYSETNLDTTQGWVRNQVREECSKIFGRGASRITMTSSTIEAHSQYKPGGVMAATVGNTAGRVLSMGTDEFGRWVYTRYNGGAGRVLIIIGVYQVGRNNHQSSGDATAISQQFSMMEQAGRPEPHRLRHHHTNDLVAFVKACQEKGEIVCVGGDFNETIGMDGSGLTKLCSECNLIDPVFERHGCTQFNTYSRGSKCIDYILIDSQLKNSVWACGYDPFNIRGVSDHRAVYLDVKTELFFGNATIPLAPMNSRDYTSKQVHNTARYFELMTEHLQDHDWFTQVKALRQCISSNKADHDLAEKLDRRRIAACLYTGNRLKKYPRAPWSPELVRLRNINCLLKVALHQKLCPEHDCSEAIQIIEDKLGSVGVDIPDSIDDLRKFQRENLKVLRATEAEEMQHATARRNYVEAKIAAYTDAGNSDAAKILRRIQRAEATAEVFKQCAVARGKCKEGGLSYVYVPEDPSENPKTCSNWRKVVDPTEVEEAIRNRLKKHFSQSMNCNLTSPPFDITMDFDAACDKADQILTGTFDTSELDPMTEDLLEAFHHAVDGEVTVDANLTAPDFLAKIKVWDERTSTSPLTDVHLGHAKAYIAKTDLDPESDEYDTFEERRLAILMGHLTILQYALKFGYSYERWQSIVNAMLEKDPGNPKIHRLRVIHLYEWDFNLLLCVKWRQLLHRAFGRKLINKACYGTMPGCSSLGPVFIKELEYEITRLTRNLLVHFDNDATSCYDRIPCFLANLASRKYGLHKAVCVVQAETLKQAKYYLKTKFGISSEYAKHTKQCPWFGTGQGSGNSPFYWLFISSTLYDLYCSKSTGGASYVSWDKQHSIKLHLLGFVDDVNNRTNVPLGVDVAGLDVVLKQLVDQASRDSQLWHDILLAANQDLELSKCKYHIIHYDWKPHGEPVLSLEKNPQDPVSIVGKDGTPVQIQHVPNDVAIKYLGCLKCCANQKQQKEALQVKCDDYARVINCSRLSRRGTQVCYQAIYRLSVGYPLPVCYFTFDELDKIQRKAHGAMVSHSGFNRHTKKAVLFGPPWLGGANFFHLYDIQGHGQLKLFLTSWRTPNSHTGKLLRITVSWAQYCSGTGTSIFIDTATKLPHLESHWLKSMRQYLNAIQGRLEIGSEFVPKLQREHDSFIMDAVLLAGEMFKPAEIRMVNYCRMYLRVSTVADISNAAGTHIDLGMYKGAESAINTNSKWYHVHQKRPNARAWHQWRRACRLLSTKQQLHTRLGAWVVPAVEIRRQWNYWQDRTSDILYHRQLDGTFNAHVRLTHDYDDEATSADVALPPQSVPVDISATDQTWRVHPHYSQWHQPLPPPEPSMEIVSYMQNLKPWERELFTGLTLKVPQQQLFQILQEEDVLIASDGSQKGTKASFGWVLSTLEGNRIVTCNGPSYGAKPNSYRAEGYGLLSVSRFLHQIRTHFRIPIKQCSVVCDNRSMVKKTSKIPEFLEDLFPNQTVAAEWDLLMEIWTTNHQHAPDKRPTFSHIKGHQDKHKPYAALSLRAQLNCDADELAEQFIQQNPDLEYSVVPLLPTSDIQLHLPMGTVTHHLKMEIHQARNTQPLAEHLQQKFNWSPETFDSVDWESNRIARNRLKKNHVTLIKHLNDVVPVGKRVRRYDPKYPAACPSCSEPIETAQHLHLCPCESRTQWRNQFLSKFREHLEKAGTRLDLMELLMEGIKSVFDNRSADTIHVPTNTHAIATDQAYIGWENILRGHISKLWVPAQQSHIGAFDPKKNGQTWAAGIIQFILQGWLDLWKLRNADRHGRDTQSRNRAHKAQAIRELELLYDLKGSILPKHNWILETPLQQRMNLSIHTMRLWINSYKPILEESYKTRNATG